MCMKHTWEEEELKNTALNLGFRTHGVLSSSTMGRAIKRMGTGDSEMDIYLSKQHDLNFHMFT